MYRSFTFIARFAAIGALAAAIGCSAGAPLTPTPASSGQGNAAADGSTLKAGAPSPLAPANNQTISGSKPTLVVGEASGQYQSRSFAYEFELQTDGGSVVRRTIVNGTTYNYEDSLDPGLAYRWRARATLNGANGPWSETARFLTPALVTVSTPPPLASAETWRVWFFALVDAKGVGPNCSIGALVTMMADLNAAGIQVQHDGAGNLRPRIFLPNPGGFAFTRAVDLGDLGRPWQWVVR